jgi:hypothetical protein
VHVRSARFLLKQAQDDIGTELRSHVTPSFSYTAVGSVANDGSDRSAVQPIRIELTGLAPDAKSIRHLEGTLEIYLPAADPRSVVRVDNLPSVYGVPIAHPTLQELGVTLVLYDRATAYRMLESNATEGPHKYDGGPIFGTDELMREAQKRSLENYPPELAAKARKAHEISETELAVGIHDPNRRIVHIEFEAPDGSALIYNHNGRYHAEKGPESRRFSVYDLGNAYASNMRFVCYLVTPGSIQAVPMQLKDLPLGD